MICNDPGTVTHPLCVLNTKNDNFIKHNLQQAIQQAIRDLTNDVPARNRFKFARGPMQEEAVGTVIPITDGAGLNMPVLPGELRALRHRTLEGAVLRSYSRYAGYNAGPLVVNDSAILRPYRDVIMGFYREVLPETDMLIRGQLGGRQLIGRTRYEFRRTSETALIIALEPELDLENATLEFARVLSKRGLIPRELLQLCTVIYRCLHANEGPGYAHFYIRYILDPQHWTTFRSEDNPAECIFLRVQLSTTKIVESVLYIATRLTQNFRRWRIRYRDAGEVWMFGAIEIIQNIPFNHGTFSHAIHAGLNFTDVVSYFAGCPDVLMRRDLNALLTNRLNKAVTGPVTNKNCLGAAIWLAAHNKFYEELSPRERRSMSKYASELGNKPDGVIEALEGGQRRNTIVFYNYRMVPIYTILGDSEELSILLFGQHAFALINREREIQPGEQALVEKTGGSPTHIKIIGAADIETCADTAQPRMCGYTFGSGTHMWHGDDCIDKMLNSLRYMPSGMIAFHNGGKFDFFYIVQALKRARWAITNALEFNGRLWFIDICYGRTRFRLFDSIGLLPMSLREAGRIYSNTIQKGDINHDLMTHDQWMHVLPVQEHRDYLDADIRVLMEALQNFDKVAQNVFGFSLLQSHLTISGAAQDYWLRTFYDPDTTPIYSLTDNQAEVIEQAYFGGSCEASWRGVIDTIAQADWTRLGETEYADVYKGNGYTGMVLKPGWQLRDRDVVAMYPAMMARHEFPYGKTEFEEFSDYPPGFRGVVVCEVRGGGGFLRVKTPLGVCTPRFKEWTQGVWTSIEIDFALEYQAEFQYEFKFIGGYRFKTAKLFEAAVNHLFDERQRHPKTSPEYKVYKLALVSLYGAWGIKRFSNGIVVKPGKREIAMLMATGRLYATNELFAYIRKSIQAKARNVTIAAFVTSYGYVHLMRTLIENRKQAIYTLYRDTDSLWQIGRIGQDTLGDSNALGGFVDEVKGIKRFALVTKKLYAAVHDSGLKISMKGFSQNKTFVKRDGVFSQTYGGTDKLQFEDVAGLLSGVPIRMRVTRFRGGLKAWYDPASVPHLTKLTQEISISGQIAQGKPDDYGWIKPIEILYYYFGCSSAYL